MTRGKNIKERTARISRKIKPLSAQLPPGDVLSGYKKQTQGESNVKPAGRVLHRSSETTHVCSDAPPSELEGYAAGKQHYGIQVKNRWQREMLPIDSPAFTDN